MNDVHAAVTGLLGAWALDACSVEEAGTVEDHLAGCPVCSAEADRLGRAVAGMAITAAVPPPAQLRGAVLEAALARRPAARADPGAGYVAWVDRFDALLRDLTPQQWRRRVFRDWSVQDLVAHLSANDELLAAQLTPAASRAPEGPAELDATLPARRSAAAVDEHRGRPPEWTRTAWRAQADRLLRDATRPAALDRPVWLSDPRLPRQPLRVAVVQRLFETWIHTGDVRAALGRPAVPPGAEHTALIVAFGVGLLPDAVRLLGGDRPARSVRLVLTGPAGGNWTLPLGSGDPTYTPDATVTTDAVEFCYLLGNRRDRGSLPHTVEGDPDLAATLLRAAATLGCD